MRRSEEMKQPTMDMMRRVWGRTRGERKVLVRRPKHMPVL